RNAGRMGHGPLARRAGDVHASGMRRVARCGIVVAALMAGAAAGEERAVITQVGGCAVGLGLRANEPVLALRPAGPLSLQETRDALERLLAELFPGGGIPAEVSSLYVGRIERLPWLSERLALAAARDPTWNSESGRPRDDHENVAVAHLLDGERLWD